MYSLGDLTDRNQCLALALSYYTLISGEMIERDYFQGSYEGTGRVYSWEDRALSLTGSYARFGDISFSIGATATYINEQVHDYSGEGFAFGIGALVKVNLFPSIPSESAHPYSYVTIGSAYNNLGPDMQMISNDYPIPYEFRIGSSYTYGYQKQAHPIWSVTGTLEISKIRYDESKLLIGIEAALSDLIALRSGIVDSDYDYETYGVGLQVDQLFSVLIPAIKNQNSFLSHLKLTYNYAYADYGILTSNSYHGLELNYR